MKQKWIKAIAIVLPILVVACAIFLSIRVYRHEKWQSGQIHSLTTKIDNMQTANEAFQRQVTDLLEYKSVAEAQLSDLQSYIDKSEKQIAELLEYKSNAETQISELRSEFSRLQSKAEYSDFAFNYLAIGNSITKHGLAEYWWNEIGMAASTEEKDYVHLVANYLASTYGNVCFHAMNFSVWETNAHDRAETLEALVPYLDPRINLITIQLGENVSDLSTYESDFEELIRYIQKNAPQARILIIDDFWDAGQKAQLKEKSSDNTGVQLLSLEEIKGKPEYQAGLGTVVFDPAGEPHMIEHEGVAAHPGDKGMQFIADLIILALDKS